MTETQVIQSINQLQLKDVYLEHANVRNLRDTNSVPRDVEIAVGYQTGVGYSLVTPNDLKIKLDFSVVFEENAPKPFELDVSLVGVYHCDVPLTEQDAESYTVTHSVPLLWPYLRELVSDLTQRMRLNPLVLPTLSIVFEPAPEESQTEATD